MDVRRLRDEAVAQEYRRRLEEGLGELTDDGDLNVSPVVGAVFV